MADGRDPVVASRGKTAATGREDAGRHTPVMVLAWAWVGLPFSYGVYELFQKLTQLFS